MILNILADMDIETREIWEIVLSKLPEQQRIVLVMRLNGYTRKEVGKIIDVTPDYVSYIFTDAKANLAFMLAIFGVKTGPYKYLSSFVEKRRII